jgi:hypothetical protein
MNLKQELPLNALKVGRLNDNQRDLAQTIAWVRRLAPVNPWSDESTIGCMGL